MEYQYDKIYNLEEFSHIVSVIALEIKKTKEKTN